jgi:hypothetical protein
VSVFSKCQPAGTTPGVKRDVKKEKVVFRADEYFQNVVLVALRRLFSALVAVADTRPPVEAG